MEFAISRCVTRGETRHDSNQSVWLDRFENLHFKPVNPSARIVHLSERCENCYPEYYPAFDVNNAAIRFNQLTHIRQARSTLLWARVTVVIQVTYMASQHETTFSGFSIMNRRVYSLQGFTNLLHLNHAVLRFRR